MRRSLGALLLLTSLPARAAETAPPPRQEKAALHWVRGESAASCPSEADVRLAIEQRLDTAVLVPTEQASLIVEAALEARSSGGFRVEIALRRGQDVVGRRELLGDDASCLRVAETAALVIALTIDPEASLEPLPIPPAPAPVTSAPLEPPPPERSAPAQDRASRSTAPLALHASTPPWQAELELSVGIASGVVPSVAGGFHARGRVLLPRLPLGVELEGAYFPEKEIEPKPGKGADFTLAYVGAGACNRSARSARLAARLCAGAVLESITGQGYGYSVTPAFQTWTLALAARAALSFRVRPPFAVTVGPSLLVPLKRDHFETETATGTDLLFRPSPLGLGFDLGAVWEL